MAYNTGEGAVTQNTPLMEKAAELLREATEGACIASAIEDRMYGAKPNEAAEKQPEPNSLEQLLIRALFRARDARQTLERINNRL